MRPISVECQFQPDGRVLVRRIQLNDRWTPVGQGRQWVADDGRHVLIMLPGDEVRELVLGPDGIWRLKPARRRPAAL